MLEYFILSIVAIIIVFVILQRKNIEKMTSKKEIFKIFGFVCFLIFLSMGLLSALGDLFLNKEQSNFVISSLLSFLSLAIACYAVVIAIDSDNKMKTIAELDFIEKNAMMHQYLMELSKSKDRVKNYYQKLILDFKAGLKVKDWLKDEKIIKDYTDTFKELKDNLSQDLLKKYELTDEFESLNDEVDKLKKQINK